ncbi:MAG: histidine kinase dimerization/phospho-acceptor domain-containing protein [Burkholderiaceae bacterium]
MDRASLAFDAPPAWRTLRYFAATRVLIASALLLTLGTLGSHDAPLTGSSDALFPIAAVYFVGGVVFAALAVGVQRRFFAQTLGQLVVDMVLISALLVSSGGLPGGYAILYLLPLAGASLLLSRVLVFFLCSVAVLVVLFNAALHLLRIPGNDSMLYQAGVFGAVLFGVTALLQWLSARLARQEQLVLERDRNLRSQLAINRLVIAQLDQGVIVVDQLGRVKANNLAARRMFGLAADALLTGKALASVVNAQELAAAFQRWRAMLGAGEVASVSASIVIHRAGGREAAESLGSGRLRARFVQPAVAETDEFLIFLQDLREVEDRAQQLKLAAMGRLTASIAHEIRNPLAAISQAGQLLSEDSSDPLQRRLAEIVRANTRRLNGLVEDVLRVARREPPAADEFDLGRFVESWLAEFESERVVEAGRINLVAPQRLTVKFEPSHLRQVVYNLVDNALRYASKRAGAVRIVAAPGAEAGVELWVFDDGPGIDRTTRAALFEPFYTTRAEGTGLGLFLAREFCETNGALLSYGSYQDLAAPAPLAGFVVRFSPGVALPLEADSMQSI